MEQGSDILQKQVKLLAENKPLKNKWNLRGSMNQMVNRTTGVHVDIVRRIIHKRKAFKNGFEGQKVLYKEYYKKKPHNLLTMDFNFND